MRILLTGAAGMVGKELRALMREQYESVLLTDIADIGDLQEKETFVRADIRDAGAMEKLARETDGIVHLAGLVGDQFTFPQILDVNVQGHWNVFGAAARAGGQRVVYMSSHHAFGFAPREDAPLPLNAPFRPDSTYGISKAFGEIVAQYYFDRYGVESLGIRVGSCVPQVMDERRLHIWCSARDLAQLIHIGLSAPDLGHRVVYGCSECPDPFFDHAAAYALGYQPMDQALDHLADPDIPNRKLDPEQPADRCIGGFYVNSKAE